MRKNPVLAMLIGALLLPLAGCNDPRDTATAEQSYGPSPDLPAPQKSWLPTVNVATATGWAEGDKPTAAGGMAVNAFATAVGHPRPAAAGRGGRRCGGERKRFHQRVEPTVGHGAGRRRFLCRGCGCDHEVTLRYRRYKDRRTGRKAGGSAGRHHQQTLDQGPHRQ